MAIVVPFLPLGGERERTNINLVIVPLLGSVRKGVKIKIGDSPALMGREENDPNKIWL